MGSLLTVADFVPLAGWALAVATFLTGTIVPVVYRRVSFEGISLRQAHNVRVVTESATRVLTFSATVKVANVGRGAVVLDGIRAPDSLSIDDIALHWVGTELKLYSPGAPITLPPSHAEGGEDFLPVVVASPEERILAIGLRFSYPPRDSPAILLSRHVERHGLTVGFRINGKYRDYTLTVGGADRAAMPVSDEPTAVGPPHTPDRSVVPPVAERELVGTVHAGEDLRGAHLAGRDLRGWVLNDADLRGADLAGAILDGAVLNGADLRGADLTGTNLHGAVLTHADLRDARLGGASLDGAILNAADFRGAAYTDRTEWPAGFDPGIAGAWGT